MAVVVIVAMVAMVVVSTVVVASAAVPVVITSAAPMMVVVRSVDLEPRQLMLLVLQQEQRLALVSRHLGQYVDDLDQAESVQGGVVLL